MVCQWENFSLYRLRRGMLHTHDNSYFYIQFLNSTAFCFLIDTVCSWNKNWLGLDIYQLALLPSRSCSVVLNVRESGIIKAALVYCLWKSEASTWYKKNSCLRRKNWNVTCKFLENVFCIIFQFCFVTTLPHHCQSLSVAGSIGLALRRTSWCSNSASETWYYQRGLSVLMDNLQLVWLRQLLLNH